jgi:hypothetical protein
MIFGLGSVMSAAPSRPPPRYLPFVRIINNEDWSEPPRHARCNSLLKYKFPAKNENVPKVADLKIQELNISSRLGRELKVSKSNLARGGSSDACIVFLLMYAASHISAKFTCNTTPKREKNRGGGGGRTGAQKIPAIVLMSIIYWKEEIEGRNRTSRRHQNPPRNSPKSESNPLMRSTLSLTSLLFSDGATPTPASLPQL